MTARDQEQRPGHRVATIPGDGIGPEVIQQALRVVEATGVELETTEFHLGAQRYLDDGQVLPDDVLDELRSFDALLLGAVGLPAVPSAIIERGLLLRLRSEFDLYVNLRPIRGGDRDVDLVVIRENTEGSYSGEGGFFRHGTPDEVALQGSINSYRGIERCIRYAFELARARERRHVTMIHKTNVLQYAGDLWMRVFEEVAADFGEVGTAYHHADAACMYLVERPERYDVIVTDNLFGDLLSDLGAAIAGGIGEAASGNIDPGRSCPSMFEPVHGSAPDIMGSGRADPRAAISSAALMLDFLGEADASRRVQHAVEATRRVQGSTDEVGAAVAAAVPVDAPVDAPAGAST